MPQQCFPVRRHSKPLAATGGLMFRAFLACLVVPASLLTACGQDDCGVTWSVGGATAQLQAAEAAWESGSQELEDDYQSGEIGYDDFIEGTRPLNARLERAKRELVAAVAADLGDCDSAREALASPTPEPTPTVTPASQLVEALDTSGRIKLAEESRDEKELLLLAKDPDAEVRATAARNLYLSYAAQLTLREDLDPTVRRSLATNPQIDASIVLYLTGDADDDVRYAVASNLEGGYDADWDSNDLIVSAWDTLSKDADARVLKVVVEALPDKASARRACRALERTPSGDTSYDEWIQDRCAPYLG